jgi:hypothetical protein
VRECPQGNPSRKPRASGYHTYADQRLSVFLHKHVMPFVRASATALLLLTVTLAESCGSAVNPDPSCAAQTLSSEHSSHLGTCVSLFLGRAMVTAFTSTNMGGKKNQPERAVDVDDADFMRPAPTKFATRQCCPRTLVSFQNTNFLHIRSHLPLDGDPLAGVELTLIHTHETWSTHEPLLVTRSDNLHFANAQGA